MGYYDDEGNFTYYGDDQLLARAESRENSTALRQKRSPSVKKEGQDSSSFKKPLHVEGKSIFRDKKLRFVKYKV